MQISGKFRYATITGGTITSHKHKQCFVALDRIVLKGCFLFQKTAFTSEIAKECTNKVLKNSRGERKYEFGMLITNYHKSVTYWCV